MSVNLGAGVDLSEYADQDLQECGDCGRNFTAAVPMLFCPECHVVAEILLHHAVRQYQRWGVLNYDS